MSAWLLRAVVMAVVHAAVQVALASVEVHYPTDLSLVRPIVLALLIGAAALWGALDGWSRRPEGGRTWFIAALVAGPVSGVLAVIGRGTLVDQTGISALWSALTGGAAFVALLILLPAALGLLVGGRMEAPKDLRREVDDAPGAGHRRAAATKRPAGEKARSRRPARHRRASVE